MTDTWVPSPPQPPGPPPPDTLPPANAWAPTTPCAAADSPSIVPSIVITGVPAIIASATGGNYVWSITLNDGAPSPNFSIDHYDATGALIEHPIAISGTNGDVTLTHDPTQPLGAATKQYADSVPPGEAPMDSYPYARYMATWERLPQSYMPEAPNTSQRFGRFNSTWQLDAIQTDAPSDGNAYGRVSNGWATVLPTTGGTITGNLTVNQVLTVQGSNSLVLNAPVTGGSQRTILGMAANIARWGLTLGDGTAEGANNVGANFSLAGYSVAGALLGNWLTIARADGSTVFNGGVTMTYGLSVNGLFALNNVGNFYLPGGAPGQALTTNGAGVLSWSAPPGGLTDAPVDGTTYARNDAAWVHLTHTDITDWATQLANYYPTSNPSGYQTAAQVTAALAPYALTANVPVGSNAAPLMNGTAAAGTGAAWSRADHVHPTDTSRYAASNPSGYQTAAQVTAVLPPASTTLPLPSGAAAVGVGTTYARADHVHPSDAYPHDNRIINGDMRIDQRNAGAATTPVGGAYVIDRWAAGLTQAGKFTAARYAAPVAGVLSALGFTYFLGLISTSAYTLLAGDQFTIRQPIEADLCADFAWGTANAQPVTLSFFVNSSLTGTFGGAISNSVTAPTRSYPFSFNIPTAGWQKVVVTIPGDSLVSSTNWVLQGNGVGAVLLFGLGVGATLSGPAGAWANGDFRSANGAVSVVSTNGVGLNFAGVKLEVGSVATPFNRQSMAKSLADCQRYFVGLGSGAYASLNVQGFANAAGYATFVQWSAPVTMRAAPTIIAAWGSFTSASGATPMALGDNRTIQGSITSTATGGYAGTLTITSLSAEL
jgi:hypothetical protein